ncbi:MAG: FkbM family methyltransferase [Verrucomicrobiota bacterium]
MYSTRWYKRVLRNFGIELKRFEFGLDAWADLDELFRQHPAKTVFDVGANCGQTSLQLATTLPGAKIVAFEPNPNLFPELQSNLAHLPLVTTAQMALGNEQTRITLNITGSPLNTSLLNYTRQDGTDRVVQKADVAMDTVDHYCTEHGIESIDLLKTDVQGYDLNVFKGAEGLLEKGRIHAVFCEVIFHKIYDGQCSFEEIYACLAKNGFRLCGLYDAVREDSFHIHWVDALFIRPDYFGKRFSRKSL